MNNSITGDLMKFERKEKYVVLKISDIKKYLIDEDISALKMICGIIEDCRHQDRKEINYYVVVNQDEPYAEIVWKLIEFGELLKVNNATKNI